MNYRTTCPHCASIFRLGPDQLDAAQGWVQCSVCGAAFDARPSLLMEDGSPLPTVEPETPAPQTAGTPSAEAEPIETIAAAPADAAPTDTLPPQSSEAEIAAAATPQGIAQREAPIELPSIILIDPEIPVPEDFGPLPQFHTAPDYPPAPPATPASVRAPAKPAASAPAAQPAARIEYAAPMPGAARPSRTGAGASARRRIRPWLWATASMLLLVLLFAQIAYFLRDTVVGRLPQARPAYEQACAMLGCTLSLPKNLALLQIVGSDLQTEASGHLRLTLTLGNRANHVQAWPVLLLTLTDQHNRPLARRSFAPSEYLADAQRIAAGVPPRSEQPLSLPLTVRDLTPMGFNLQLSY